MPRHPLSQATGVKDHELIDALVRKENELRAEISRMQHALDSALRDRAHWYEAYKKLAG